MSLLQSMKNSFIFFILSKSLLKIESNDLKIMMEWYRLVIWMKYIWGVNKLFEWYKVMS